MVGKIIIKKRDHLLPNIALAAIEKIVYQYYLRVRWDLLWLTIYIYNASNVTSLFYVIIVFL